MKDSVSKALDLIGHSKRRASRRRKRDLANVVLNVTADSVFAGDDRRNLDIITAQEFEKQCAAMRSNVALQREREKKAYELLKRLCPPYLRLGPIMPSGHNIDQMQKNIIKSHARGDDPLGTIGGPSAATDRPSGDLKTSEKQRRILMKKMIHEDPLQFGNVLWLSEADYTEAFRKSGAPIPQPPWLVNFAIVFTLGITEINLEGVRAIPGFHSHYGSRGFPALTVWFRLDSGATHQCVTMRIHSSGRVVLTGARTEQQALLGSLHLVNMLQRHGFPVAMCDFAIQNLVLTMDVGLRIDLNRLSREQGNRVTYVKANFPLAEYKLGNVTTEPGEKKVAHVALISETGKLVIAGTKSHDEARKRCMETYVLAWMYREEESANAPEPSASNGITGFMTLHDMMGVYSMLSTGSANPELEHTASGGNTRRGALQWLERNPEAVDGVGQPPRNLLAGGQIPFFLDPADEDPKPIDELARLANLLNGNEEGLPRIEHYSELATIDGRLDDAIVCEEVFE